MRKRKKILLGIVTVLIIGFLIPQNLEMPVKEATKSDYNSKSFWFYPWGKSVTHKGVDIFAKKGTEINSSTSGLVLYAGEINVGGKVVVVVGPKWRIHYYAHLNELNTSLFSFVSKESKIGTVGASGNAVGKSPHLHYSILTIIPYLWRMDSDKQGWKKMFYLNPIEYFEKIKK
ncbi:M23 family metallopeptidase [Winogradskyella sp. HaHa_3_26]|uniref:M23 family metallopeptidase n=1 Tax=Winogradskyella sp. HaHa_3_26 TaxID=2749995 RepID=UPI0015CDE1BF|nr:M23 family metallopeptidase [Winogradskyella sp. HaHa_3_26]QXP79094.1 M23 family metallopeptidase [Winogradskyella sp. HaHa_3_26]